MVSTDDSLLFYSGVRSESTNCSRKEQVRVLLSELWTPRYYRHCKVTEKARLLPLASVNRAHRLASSEREENLRAFIMARAESLFAAPRGPETLTSAEAAARRSGHTSLGAACPDCAPVWSGLIGGFLRPLRPAATASSGSPSNYAPPLHSGQSCQPAASRRQLPGRSLRERGTPGERPGGSAPLAPPGGEE